MYQVEDNHPVPEVLGRNRYPFREMAPGQSFLVKAEDAAKARTAARVFMNRNTDVKLGWKRVEEGIRIWRIG